MSIFNKVTKSFQWGDKTVVMETGEIARQASGLGLSPDELHMNDWSYGCVAKLLAGAIAEAATRTTLTAGVSPR